MGKVRVVLAMLLILLGLMTYSNPQYLDNALDRDHAHDTNYNLIELQNNEEWLVLKISFPNKPFDSSEVEELFEGTYSAEEYINSLNGISFSVAYKTILPADS